MHQLDQPIFGAHLEEVFVQLEPGVVLFVFLPTQEILLLCTDRAVLQSFGIIAREDELHGAEKGCVELRLLVGNTLADPVANRDAAVLQLQHAHGDAVHIQHDVRAPFQVAEKSDLLGDGKVVLFRLRPIDQMDGFGDLSRLDLYRYAVTQQAVNGLVVAVKAAAVIVRLRAQCSDGFVDLRRAVAGPGEKGSQQVCFDVPVVVAIPPVAEVPISEFITKQGDDPILGGAFGLADHINRVFPVSRFCIMPCLSRRYFSSLASRAVISASMSERM